MNPLTRLPIRQNLKTLKRKQEKKRQTSNCDASKLGLADYRARKGTERGEILLYRNIVGFIWSVPCKESSFKRNESCKKLFQKGRKLPENYPRTERNGTKAENKERSFSLRSGLRSFLWSALPSSVPGRSPASFRPVAWYISTGTGTRKQRRTARMSART